MNFNIHVNDMPVPYKGRRHRHQTLFKYLIAMKLFAIILLLSLNVSARVYSQKVSLSVKNAKLTEVMKEVRKQTGYYFMFAADIMKDAKLVSVELKRISIEEALPLIFKDQPFTYELQEKGVLIKPKSKPEGIFFQKAIDLIKDITIRGKVTDTEGKPLPGASVKAGGKTTVTDANGNFNIEGINEDVIVEISYIGYRTATVKATVDFVAIVLQSAASDLNEVVINKGYYTTTRELNTGTVSVVNATDLRKSPVSDPVLALQGRVPGLYIFQNTGVTGSAINIKLRGQNSLRAGSANDPLFIVNGMPFTSQSLSTSTTISGAALSISPFIGLQLNDIESIEVLKDADATAIYGSRGANGVVLITTKKGSPGKTRVDVNVSQGTGDVAKTLDFLNSPEYLEMRHLALANDGITNPGANDNDLNGKWGDINRYTDWQKVMIGGTAHLTNVQAVVSGGNVQTQFLFGGSYRRESTVFPGDFRDKKISGNFSLNHESENNRFKSSLSALYVNDNNLLPIEDYTKYTPLAPNAPILYNDDGSLNWQNSSWNNPLRSLFQSARNLTTNLNSSLNLSYEVIKDLTLSVRGGYSTISLQADHLTPLKGTNPDIAINPASRRHQYTDSEVKSWIVEPTINYSRDLFGGKVDVLVGSTWQRNDQNALQQSFSGFSSDALINNLAAATTVSVANNTMSVYKYNAIYARVAYNYGDQYLFNLTGRRDASSRFGPDKQFANFGAIGAGWIFTKQTAISKSLPFLSFGKIRGSYGVTGNDQILDYGFLSTYSSTGTTYQGVALLTPTQLTNPNYRWENVRKLEFGLDLGFLKDRIYLNINRYKNRTGNQLVGYALPDIAGFPSVQANLPALLENTGTEFEITSNNVVSKKFSWTTSANLSIPKSRLIKFDGIENSGYATRYKVGEPLSLLFGYRYTGIDPATGIYTFEDLGNDGKFGAADFQPFFRGQKYFGGLNNSFGYKGLQLDVFFQFVKQNANRVLSVAAPGVYFAAGPNQLKSNVPTTKNDNGVQKLTQNLSSEVQTAYGRFGSSNAIIVDGSFIRLKNVSLSWNIPEHWKSMLHLQSARLYLQGQNLFTITNYDGFDPETGSIGSGAGALKLPPLRMIVVGIQVTL